MAKTYQRKIPLSVDCGIHLFMETMNGKWKIGLLWSIYNGIKRPGELHKRIPKASRRVLDNQLSEMVSHQLIIKNTFDEKPVRAEYELTDLGKSLIPLIKSTAKWGEENREVLEQAILSKQSIEEQ